MLRAPQTLQQETAKTERQSRGHVALEGILRTITSPRGDLAAPFVTQFILDSHGL